MYIVNLSNWLNNENEFPYLNTDNDWERLVIPIEFINDHNGEIKNKGDNDWEFIHPPTLTYADIVKRKKNTMDLQTPLSLKNKNNQNILYQKYDTIPTITTTTTTKRDHYIYYYDDDDSDVIDEIYYAHKSKRNNRLQKDSLEYRRRVRVLSFCHLATNIEAYDWEPYDAKMDKTGVPSDSKRDVKLLIYPIQDPFPNKTGFHPPANPRFVLGNWKYICITDRDYQLDRERRRHIRFLIDSTS